VAAELPVPLPREPHAIEALVLRLVPWAQDSDVWGLPWYFPTPHEALAARRGDCEAQAVLTASLLAARGIPYQLRASFSHIWVDYPGRGEIPGESQAEAVMQQVDGRYRFNWPRTPRLVAHLRTQKGLLWDGLAPWRKGLLLIGWPVMAVGLPRLRRRGGGRGDG
jgi:hypothetical protein